MFGINTTRDISKLSQITLAQQLVKWHITISKYRSWYLRQISLQIMLLPVQNLTNLQGDHWLNCHRLLTFLQSCHWSGHYFHCYLQLKTNHRKKNKMSKGKLLILIQLHGTHILLRKVLSTHVQIFFNVKFFSLLLKYYASTPGVFKSFLPFQAKTL